MENNIPKKCSVSPDANKWVSTGIITGPSIVMTRERLEQLRQGAKGRYQPVLNQGNEDHEHQG
jgi:hypothetical protein